MQLEEAIVQLLEQDDYTCVLKRANLGFVSKEEGFIPLLQWLNTGMNFSGAMAAAKIVGKAEAFLYAEMNVASVYANVISSSALEVLQHHQIAVQYENLIPAMMNHSGDICTAETALLQVNDLQTGIEVLRSIREEMLRNMTVSETHSYEKRG